MYQVLYRKYRPQVFEDVVGQPQVTTTLKNELSSGRINHAYLFTGSRGTGKTTCAKILAKAVNCLSPNGADPCSQCEICKGIDNSQILDVVEMDAASNRKIDDIRNIIDEVAFTPAKCKYRVYIIDEVHMLTTEAFNALLKTLEEPPAHVIFILATTEVHKLPSTIVSRCQRFDFHRISPKDIANRLKDIARFEGVNITDEAALLAAVVADGAMRDAISLLDRSIGISPEVTADTVRTAAGLAQKKYLFELCTCTINKNCAKALEIIDDLYSQSKDMPRLCEELSSHFRSLMLIKTVKNPRELLAMSDNEFEAAQSQCDYLSLADIVYSMDILSRSYERMSKGVNNRTELEMAIVKLCSPQLDESYQALTARVSSLERAINMLQSSPAPSSDLNAVIGKKTSPTESKAPDVDEEKQIDTDKEQIALSPQSADITEENVVQAVEEVSTAPIINNDEADAVIAVDDNSAPAQQIADDSPRVNTADEQATQNNTPKTANKINIDEVYENAQPFLQWPDVVNNLKNYSQAISSAFEGSSAYVSGDYLLIDTDQEIAFNLLKKSAQRDNIRKAVCEITRRTYKLGPYKRPEEKQKQDDVLKSFIDKLKSEGINVTEE